MNKIIGGCIAVVLLCAFTSGWQTSFEQAKQQAAKEHKYILLNFSGSDWCGPCIRLKETVFNTPAFVQFADSSLVLLNADFPRQKKNQLSKEQVKLNEALAEKYNPDGKFPFTLLVDEHGKVLTEWDGYPNESTDQFIDQIKPFTNDSH